MEISPVQEGIEKESRLVFYSWVEQDFYKMAIIPRREIYTIMDEKILKRPFDYKYKLQEQRDGRWQDATRYFSLGEETGLQEFLLGKNELNRAEMLELVDIYLPEPHEWLARRLPSIVYSIFQELETNPGYQQRNLRRFLRAIKKRRATLPENGVWLNLWFYLGERLRIHRKFKQTVFEDKNYDQICEIVRAGWGHRRFFRRRIAEAEKFDLQMARVLAGHLYSLLGERTNAIAEYKKAASYDFDYAVQFVYDMGIHTFFQMGDHIDFQSQVVFAEQEPPIERQLTILISVDPKFLRIYSVPLFYFSLIQKDLHFHFHVIGEEEETLSAIAEASVIYGQIAGFQGKKNEVSRPSFSSEQVPAFVLDHKTYYACARYIHSADFMDYFNSDLYIMDADMLFNRDSNNYFQDLKAYDLGLSFSGQFQLLVPWRRVMGGNVYVANRPGPRKFIQEVRAYILQGLHEPVSWTLDQNALLSAYENLAVTQPDLKVVNLKKLGIPMFQPLYRRVVEQE